VVNLGCYDSPLSNQLGKMSDDLALAHSELQEAELNLPRIQKVVDC
jgi:hypothetical protein